MAYQAPVRLNNVGRNVLSARNLLILWLVGLTLYRIAVTTQSHMGLFFDEAYYFHWAQLLDWGYYSKPPMVAWFIALTTQIFGVSEVAVKLAAPILYCASAWIIFVIGRRLADERTGIIAALIFSTAPIVGFNSLFITTDAPLFFFWALSMYLALTALEKGNLWSWLLLGLTLGCGMLSKYTFAALVLGLLAYIVWTKRYQLFVQRGFWLATCVSLLLASTNLVWNWQHDFIAFTHTKEIAKLDGDLVKPVALLKFFFTQFFVIGIFWVVYAVVQNKHWAERIPSTDALRFLIATMLPILVLVGMQAFLSRAFANWAGAFIVPGSILLAFILRHAAPKTICFGLACNLILLSLFYHWPIVLGALDVSESKKNSPYYRLSGWREASEIAAPQIDPLRKQGFSPILISDSRELLAYVGYYNAIHARNLYYWNPNRDNIRNHYDLKNNAHALLEGESDRVLLFLRKDPVSDEVGATFASVELLRVAEYAVSPEIKRKYYIYQVKGFKGYAD